MPAIWRLIEHGPVDGALNMAIDRAVQFAREEGVAPPTLRLYRWARPTLTLGRFQDEGSIDRDYCAEAGIDVVRRFTGGRGVLHDHESTYSVVADLEDGVPRGVAASYRHLCAALIETYRELGVDAALTRRDRGDTSTAACYLQTTRADLSVGMHKLSGSAQVWSGTTVLQHGSFTFSRNTDRETRAFRLTGDHARRLAVEAFGLVDLLGREPEENEVRRAAVTGFERALGIALVPGALTAFECDLAARLRPEVRLGSQPSP
jgi:lipoate-protein ligase A